MAFLSRYLARDSAFFAFVSIDRGVLGPGIFLLLHSPRMYISMELRAFFTKKSTSSGVCAERIRSRGWVRAPSNSSLPP